MKSLDELKKIKERMQQNATVREDSENTAKIVIGMATCGIAAGARPVLSAISAELAKRHLENVTVSQTGCIGMCTYEPIVDVYLPNQDKVTYVKVSPEKVAKIINDHIVNGKPVPEFTVQAE